MGGKKTPCTVFIEYPVHNPSLITVKEMCVFRYFTVILYTFLGSTVAELGGRLCNNNKTTNNYFIMKGVPRITGDVQGSVSLEVVQIRFAHAD